MGSLGSWLDEWIAEVTESLAYAIVAAIAVIDVGTVVLDGAFPKAVRAKVAERTRAALAGVNQQGLSNFRMIEGAMGDSARAMGGATLILLANFSQDREVLFKDAT